MCNKRMGIISLSLLICFLIMNIDGSLPHGKAGNRVNNNALAYGGGFKISNILQCEMVVEDEPQDPQDPAALARPAKPSFNDGIAYWQHVENENGGYSLQLYRDGDASGPPAIIAHGEDLAYDFSSSFTGIGDYTFTVKALGHDAYADSEESEHSNIYDDYIRQFNNIGEIHWIQQAVEDSRLGLNLAGYNSMSPLQKYLAAEKVLQGKGAGYTNIYEIQDVLDSAVNSLIIPEGSVRSLIYGACSKTTGDNMEIALQTTYKNVGTVDNSLKVDGKISFSLPFTSDVTINGFAGNKTGTGIGTIDLPAGSSHFWIGDFPGAGGRPALSEMADDTENYTFIIENIPEEFNNAVTTVTVSTIASTEEENFEDNTSQKNILLSSDSMDVCIGSSEKPLQVYVENTFDSSTPGWGALRFKNIHDAVAGVRAGGIVHMGKGTHNLTDLYHKKLEINKEITIKGEGMDVTTLFAYVTPNTTQAINVNGTREFKLHDLTIDGGNKSFSYGIYATGGHVDIRNVRFDNIKSKEDSCAIKILDNTSGFSEMLDVNGCIFQNITMYGIYIDGARADIGTEVGNTFTGGCSDGIEHQSQSAIFVTDSEEVNIENNHISGYVKPDSAGIYIKSGTVYVKGNMISDDCTEKIKGEYIQK